MKKEYSRGEAICTIAKAYGTDMERLRDDLAMLSLGSATAITDLGTDLLGQWLYVLHHRGMIA